MTADEIDLSRLRLDLLAADLGARRAAGWRYEVADLVRALVALPPQQAAVMRLALADLTAGRRRPNLARVARQLGVHPNTARELYQAGRINLGAALTDRNNS